MKKIIALTNSRSDYDLMSYVYKFLNDDKEINFKLFVGGGHFSAIHNKSFKLIEKDNFKNIIICKSHVETHDETSRVKSSSRLLFKLSEFLKKEKPDLILYAGDREEVIVGAMSSAYLSIPSVHFFAGDHDSDGLVDNPIRHATSILSSFCVTTIQEHKLRLIKLGIKASRIKVFGSPALDKFIYEKKNSREDLVKKFKSNIFLNEYALLIHHPLMNFEKESILEIKNILSVLKQKKIHTILMPPNLDFGNFKIKYILENFEKKNKNFKLLSNIHRTDFVNIYRNCLFQIGNSSSGILESASLKIPAINVGDRMHQRKSNDNVIFCNNKIKSIENAIEKAQSSSFRCFVKQKKNIYYKKNSSKKIYKFIKNLNTTNYRCFRYMDPLKNK